MNPIEQLFADQRLEVATSSVDAVIGHVEDADVQSVLEHHVKRLRTDLQPTPSAQPQSRNLAQNFLLRKATRCKVLECAADERSPFTVFNKALARPSRCVEVSDRFQERPTPELQRGPHAGTRAVRPAIVVELRERGQHAFHQFPGRGVVNRFCRRSQGNPKRLQVSAQREVVVLLSGKARQVEDHDELDLPLVSSAVLQQLLQLGPMCSLGAFALFPESFENLEALAATVVLARSKLCREAQILRLSWIRDTDVDDCTDHRRKIRPILWHGQGARVGHVHLSSRRRTLKEDSTRMCAIASARRRTSSISSSESAHPSSPSSSRH